MNEVVVALVGVLTPVKVGSPVFPAKTPVPLVITVFGLFRVAIFLPTD